MNLKALAISVAILAALAAVAFVARRPSAPASADARLNQSLVAETVIGEAARLRLTDQGRTVTLARQADGSWQVSSYHDLPADFAKLSTLVENLTTARLQRLVTSNPERIARLEFDGTRIELLNTAGQPLLSLALGRQAEGGVGRFVRYGDESKAYLANLTAWLDAESKNWANPELLSLRPETIARVEIPLGDGAALVVSRAKAEDPWTAESTPTGQRLRADKISSLLTSLGTLRFTDTTSPEAPEVTAAKANLRTFRLTTFDQKIVTIGLGRKPEEKRLKPPSSEAGVQSGPGALGSVSDLAKQGATDTAAGANPLAPEFETIPAGPGYAFVTHSDADAPINAWMSRRAYQVSEFTFTSLPQGSGDLFEPAPDTTVTPAP